MLKYKIPQIVTLTRNCFPTNVNNSKIVPKHLSGNLVSESNIRKMAGGDYGSADFPGW